MPPKLRPIGTCEHIWSPWRPVAEMGEPRRSMWLARRDEEWRECELCWGHQFARGEEQKRAWERASLAADLTGVRPMR